MSAVRTNGASIGLTERLEAVHSLTAPPGCCTDPAGFPNSESSVPFPADQFPKPPEKSSSTRIWAWLETAIPPASRRARNGYRRGVVFIMVLKVGFRQNIFRYSASDENVDC